MHRGDRGCVVGTKDAPPCSVPAISAQVIDTNGAGDTHNGVFLASLMEGVSAPDAARRANFAASVAIGLLGPAQSPARPAIDAWFAAFRDA